jgi:hypothetical protein
MKNQRLIELAYEAGIRFSTTGVVLAGGKEAVEKFAGLLVKECILVIKNESMGSTDEWENGLHIAVEAIEHNLGVEE